jgi:tetratricopeptide (TPR) repeat protein
VCDRQGNYQAGYEAFTQALACRPELQQGPWRDRSSAYIKNRFYLDVQQPLLTDLALKALEYTLTSAPPAASLVALKAEALWLQYLARGARDTGLVGAYQRALGELMALMPDSPEVHYVQALYFRRENREQAETEWLQALAGDSTYAEALCRLGEMYIAFSAPDKALAIYEKALAVRPGYLPAMIGRGLVYLKQYKYPEAAPAYYNLGVARENTGQVSAAIRCYLRAITLDPRMTGACYNLGRIHYFSDELDRSMLRLQQAVAADSLYFDAYIFMANVYLKRNETALARTVLENVLKKDPANELAQQNLAKIKQN